jgi:hypothetical protein
MTLVRNEVVIAKDMVRWKAMHAAAQYLASKHPKTLKLKYTDFGFSLILHSEFKVLSWLTVFTKHPVTGVKYLEEADFNKCRADLQNLKINEPQDNI